MYFMDTTKQDLHSRRAPCTVSIRDVVIHETQETITHTLGRVGSTIEMGLWL